MVSGWLELTSTSLYHSSLSESEEVWTVASHETAPWAGAVLAAVGGPLVGGAGAALVGGGADGLGDPLADALGDGLGDPDTCDACAEAEAEAAGLLVLLLETHPTTVMISKRVSGGAAIKKGVRRQKGFGPSRSLPDGCLARPRGGRPSDLPGLPDGCSLLIHSPKRHHEMKVTFRTSSSSS